MENEERKEALKGLISGILGAGCTCVGCREQRGEIKAELVVIGKIPDDLLKEREDIKIEEKRVDEVREHLEKSLEALEKRIDDSWDKVRKTMNCEDENALHVDENGVLSKKIFRDKQGNIVNE